MFAFCGELAMCLIRVVSAEQVSREPLSPGQRQTRAQVSVEGLHRVLQNEQPGVDSQVFVKVVGRLLLHRG